MNNRTTFFAEWLTLADTHLKKPGEKLAFYDAVLRYGLTGDCPQVSGKVQVCFELARKHMDDLKSRRNNYRCRNEKVESTDNLPTISVESTDNLPTISVESTDNLPTISTTKEKTPHTSQKNLNNTPVKSNDFMPPAQKKFRKPTLEEVTAYCEERQNGIDPAHFIDFYESKGWKIGKNPMKDWKAAIRTWEKHNAKPRRDYTGI